MVSKYFHLSEDYSYKAVISKAYMGFKDQADGLDPIFQERLFAAAITQLDANPLRFLNSSHAGSPLQDLFQQPFMQSALQDNIKFRDEMIGWIKNAFKTNNLPKINFSSPELVKSSGVTNMRRCASDNNMSPPGPSAAT